MDFDTVRNLPLGTMAKIRPWSDSGVTVVAELVGFEKTGQARWMARTGSYHYVAPLYVTELVPDAKRFTRVDRPEPSEYSTWQSDREAAKVAAAGPDGNVHDYLQFMLDHPSPLGGVMGVEHRSDADVARAAVESTFTSFTGHQARVSYTGPKDPNYSVVYSVTGQLAGLGFICDGPESKAAVAVTDEFGRTMMIAVSAVTGVEDA